MSITFITGQQRAQTAYSIYVADIKILNKKAITPKLTVIKQTKTNKAIHPLSING